MDSITHASTISLTPDEIAHILVAALNLPSDTTITFNVNQATDAARVYSRHFCSGVTLTFREQRTIGKVGSLGISRE